MKKTEKRVLKALASCIGNKLYKDISVNDLIAEADIGRSTFYLHFNSKDQVMIRYIDNMFEEFFDKISPLLQNNVPLGKLIGIRLFETFLAEPQFSVVLLQADGQSLIDRRFHAYLSRFIGRIARNAPETKLTRKQVHYASKFWTTGTLAMVTDWVREGFKESPEEIGELYANLTQPSINLLLVQKN